MPATPMLQVPVRCLLLFPHAVAEVTIVRNCYANFPNRHHPGKMVLVTCMNSTEVYGEWK